MLSEECGQRSGQHRSIITITHFCDQIKSHKQLYRWPNAVFGRYKVAAGSVELLLLLCLTAAAAAAAVVHVGVSVGQPPAEAAAAAAVVAVRIPVPCC